MNQAMLAALVAVTAVTVAHGQSQIVAWGDNQYGQCSVPGILVGITALS